MDIKKEMYNIIDKFDGKGDVDGCISEIEDFLKGSGITDFNVEADMDVFESCGLDIYYICAAWNDEKGLNLFGSALFSY